MREREERGPLLIKKQCSKGQPKVETGGMFGMNKFPLSFVWWHWQIELRVWKGDLSLMGNEFKVMEMNVLFEVQKALAEVILSHSNKWKQHCHMVSSPWLDSSKRRECDVSLGTAVPRLVLRHCYWDSSTFVLAGHCSLPSVWSGCVIECAAQISVLDRQAIDFCGRHRYRKATVRWVCCSDVVPSQQFSQLRTPAGYQWPGTWIFNQFFVLNLCVVITDIVFKMCTNPFLVNCSQRQLQIDLAMIQYCERRDGVRDERHIENNKTAGRGRERQGRASNEAEWDVCCSV